MKAVLGFLIVVMMLLANGCGAVRVSQPSADLSDNFIKDISPYRFYETTITYSVIGKDSNIPLIDIEASIERGFRKWEYAIFPFKLVKSPISEDENAMVRFRLGDRDKVQGKWGLTEPHKVGYRIFSADVYILRSLLPPQMEVAAMHEGGHVLGIGGHSKNKKDLMSADSLSLLSKITTRDANTVAIIYRGLSLAH